MKRYLKLEAEPALGVSVEQVNEARTWKSMWPYRNQICGGIQRMGNFETIVRESEGRIGPVINEQ